MVLWVQKGRQVHTAFPLKLAEGAVATPTPLPPALLPDNLHAVTGLTGSAPGAPLANSITIPEPRVPLRVPTVLPPSLERVPTLLTQKTQLRGEKLEETHPVRVVLVKNLNTVTENINNFIYT